MTRKQHTTQPTRFAIYARFSSDAQNDITLESQEMMCRRAITERGGVVSQVYKDAAKFGWSLDRDGFNQLREDATRGKFDAVMMWKFDRLARDHTQATMIKALLRHEYGIKLFCVEGYSEDDDSSPYTAMMEQMLTVMAAFYSKNLSTEVKRANQHRYSTGKFNGGKPPFGYLLATEKTPKREGCFKATDKYPPGLYVDARAAALVRRAFKMYATGLYGFSEITRFLNSKAALLRTPRKKAFALEMVREMLQNKIYAGFVSYAETVYNGGFGQSKAGRRGRVQWAAGAHAPIISGALYEQCQIVRQGHAVKRTNPNQNAIRLLSMKVYCAHCLLEMKSDDPSYGRMTANQHRGIRYWNCRSERKGYAKCDQPQVREQTVNDVVIHTLSTLADRLPDDIQSRVESVVRSRASAAADMQRLEALRETVERIDFSWEQGFIDQETYAAKRRQLQFEIESSKPVEYDDMLKSARILKDFCKLFAERDERQRQELIDQIVERVIVKGDKVIAVVLRGDTPLLLESSDELPPPGGGSYREGGVLTNCSHTIPVLSPHQLYKLRTLAT